MDVVSRILIGNYCNLFEVKKNNVWQCQVLKRLVIGDWWDEYDVYILWLFDLGILWDINNIVINQWMISWFCEDGDKVCFWIYFMNCNCSIIGIYQVINNDEVFVIVFCVFQYFKFVLVVVIVVGNINGIDMMNIQFMCQ